MPLVRIEMSESYNAVQARLVADAIHSAIVEVLGIPVSDRFQILNRLPTGSIIAEDAGLGFERTAGIVMIQIFTQRGRSRETKQHLYQSIANHIAAVGVQGQDLFIGYQENGPEDWSFGFGRAQYITGELSVPGVGHV